MLRPVKFGLECFVTCWVTCTECWPRSTLFLCIFGHLGVGIHSLGHKCSTNHVLPQFCANFLISSTQFLNQLNLIVRVYVFKWAMQDFFSFRLNNRKAVLRISGDCWTELFTAATFSGLVEVRRKPLEFSFQRRTCL